ncbi:hypothetical protein OHS70_34065 [Streptomyces sp. NBC_00390]|uniref:hypothetical protein n=1 Tax=Streptomyces sp. NBC_00390 TaxID=2975736 RepID=UPI002E1BA618
MLNAQTDEAWFAAVQRCRAGFHPSLLAEADYRARRAPLEGDGELLGHIAVSLFMFTIGENLRLRDARGAVDQQFVASALSTYTSLMSDREGESLALHVRTARAALGASLAVLPGNEERVDRLRTDLRASLETCADREHLRSIIGESLCNLFFLLLDGPSTRLPMVAFTLGSREKWEDLPRLMMPSFHFDTPESLERYVDELRDFAAELREGELGSGGQVVEDIASALEAVDLGLMPADSRERWPVGSGPCANCAMLFASRSPLVLDQDSPSISENGGIVFFRDSLNRARCLFCSTDARLETPGLLYWKERGAIYYRLPLTPNLRRDEAEEFYREVVTGLRKQYRSQLSKSEAEEFDAAIEIITHGWGQWVHAVHMGDVIWEDHVLTLVDTGPESGVVVDVTKKFMQEVSGHEYLEWREGVRNHQEILHGAPEPDGTRPGRPDLPGRKSTSSLTQGITRLFRRNGGS